MSLTLWQYYVKCAENLAKNAFNGITTLDDWKKSREVIKSQFFKSMGLSPMPKKCDLKITDCGEFKGEGYKAKKIAYQIFPDCWGSGNFYLPDPLPAGKLPAVLFVCGHHPIGIHGYQDHAALWARRGYACFVFDTIEQHDNTGTHRGLIGGFRPDWLSMGYTAAGGELLNSIRALDVLCSMKEIDTNRIGATGISGGGAHSFYVTVADERIKALATVAGVATPEYTLGHRHFFHHCDCMYFHNPYMRDTSEFAALIAPRPLLYCFASEDGLFSPTEYKSLAERTGRIYKLFGCEDKCQLFEYPGPHAYQPETVERINQWFDKFVAGEEHPLLQRDELEHRPAVLSVFDGKIPQPDRLDILPELLTPPVSIRLPQGKDDWPEIKKQIKRQLRNEIFYAIDNSKPTFEFRQLGDWYYSDSKNDKLIRFSGKVDDIEIWADLWQRQSENVVIGIADPDANTEQMRARTIDRGSPFEITFVYIEPRGTGMTGTNNESRKNLLRAGALTGKPQVTLAIEDLKLILPEIYKLELLKGKKFYLYGEGDAAVACLYHAIFDENIEGVILKELPASHKDGGYIPNILQVVDIQHALALLAPKPVGMIDIPLSRCSWASKVYERLDCPEKFIINASLEQQFKKVLSIKYQ